MGPAGDAYLQGGATLVLVIFASAVIAYLIQENRAQRADIKTLQKEKEDLYKSSVEMLRTHQQRDQEDLKSYREAERRRVAGPLS